MKKGVIVNGTVTNLAFPNRGVVEVKEEGAPVRVKVKGVLPGQEVAVRILKTKHGNPEGQLLEVLQKSPAESDADCPHFDVCGGCSYRTLPYEEQLKLKEAQMKALFAPVLEAGGVSLDSIYEGINASPVIEGYRNKMEFSFGDEYKDGPLSLGLHKRGSMYDIVPVKDCRIVDEDYRKILCFSLNFFKERNIPYFHKTKHTGYLRHLLVRKSKKYGEILVALVTTKGTNLEEQDLGAVGPLLDDYVAGLRALPLEGTLTGIVHTLNDSVADTVLDEGSEVLYGRSYIREELLGLEFKISQFSFFQTNSLGAEVLYGKVREFLVGDAAKDALTAETTPGEKPRVIYDLYSGTGTIAQLMAPVADKVVGVEIVEEAVEAAKENAALNGLSNCEFIAGDVLKVLDDLTKKPDLIILDPPRDGIHPKALPKIINYGVDKMVYVSCKPTSLARDLEVFMACGYKPTRLCLVDMFPGTVHVETVCLLSNRKPDSHIKLSLDMDEYYDIIEKEEAEKKK